MTKLAEAHKVLLAGKNELSVSLFRAAVEDEPRNPLAHQGLADALLRTRAYDEAMDEANKALELDPRLASPHVVMAYASYGKKDMDNFRAEASRAYDLHLGSGSAEALTCYGVMLLVDGKLDADIKMFNDALQMNPADIEARKNLVYAYDQTGDRKKALDQNWKIFLLSPSVSAGIKLFSAFHTAHTLLFGVANALFLLFAIILHRSYLLIVPLLYDLIGLYLAVRLIASRKWRPAFVAILYSAVQLAILYVVFILTR